MRELCDRRRRSGWRLLLAVTRAKCTQRTYVTEKGVLTPPADSRALQQSLFPSLLTSGQDLGRVRGPQRFCPLREKTRVLAEAAGNMWREQLAKHPQLTPHVCSSLGQHPADGRKTETRQINSDVLFWKAHMHIFQTQKMNVGVNAVTDQLLTTMQQGKGGGPPALVSPQRLQEGWEPGYRIPTDCQRKRNRNGRLLVTRKTYK